MSRLDFAPKIDAIKVTDIKRGLGEFIPKPDKAVSFDALKATLKKAGYALAPAEITVAGTLVGEDSKRFVEADGSKQRFALEGDNLNQVLGGAEAGSHLQITGDWQTAGKDRDAREVIRPATAKKISAPPNTAFSSREKERDAIRGIEVSLDGVSGGSDLFFSSVRTTSPGLTVYKGGAVVPRYSFTRQRLGDLKADRHALRFSLSYTPTQTLQLEAEVPYQATSFDDGMRSGSGSGFGNITVWGKYRFYRALETSYVYRSRGRIGGREVDGSSSSEFYLAPGLQFTATPRLVLEASYQFPVVRNMGPLVLRTDRNVLVGVRYLY